MVFLVDTDGDGDTDHFVTVIGYDDGTPHQYGCYDTWAASPGIRWETFQGMGSVAWGIWGGWSFNLSSGDNNDPILYNGSVSPQSGRLPSPHQVSSHYHPGHYRHSGLPVCR